MMKFALKPQNPNEVIVKSFSRCVLKSSYFKSQKLLKDFKASVSKKTLTFRSKAFPRISLRFAIFLLLLFAAETKKFNEFNEKCYRLEIVQKVIFILLQSTSHDIAGKTFRFLEILASLILAKFYFWNIFCINANRITFLWFP